MIKPISPTQVKANYEARHQRIPDNVFAMFNRFIEDKWDGREAIIGQDDILNRLSRESGLLKGQILEMNWLDIEGLYTEQGWKVEYHAPAPRGDNHFPPYFRFTDSAARPVWGEGAWTD